MHVSKTWSSYAVGARTGVEHRGCAFLPAPAALRGPLSLNSCPSLTAIGMDRRGCATPCKTQAITRRKRERPARVWGRERVENLWRTFQAIDRPGLQGKRLASLALRSCRNGRFALRRQSVVGAFHGPFVAGMRPDVKKSVPDPERSVTSA